MGARSVCMCKWSKLCHPLSHQHFHRHHYVQYFTSCLKLPHSCFQDSDVRRLYSFERVQLYTTPFLSTSSARTFGIRSRTVKILKLLFGTIASILLMQHSSLIQCLKKFVGFSQQVWSFLLDGLVIDHESGTMVLSCQPGISLNECRQ